MRAIAKFTLVQKRPKFDKTAGNIARCHMPQPKFTDSRAIDQIPTLAQVIQATIAGGVTSVQRLFRNRADTNVLLGNKRADQRRFADPRLPYKNTGFIPQRFR